jgi:ligand-binding sensor protein
VINRQLNLADLINVKDWQEIQDNFSLVTGASLRIVDEQGELITSPSGQSRLCRELIQESPFKDAICGKCLPTFLGGKQVLNRNLDFECLPGVHNFISPLGVESGKVLGYLIVGPVFLVTRQPKQAYQRVAEEFKIDLDEFWAGLLEIKVISYQGAQSLVELVRDVAEYILKCAYQSVNQQKQAALFVSQPELKRVLEVLLDVAFQVSGADIGSIMFFEKDRDYLTIQASRGIPDDIARDARVRLGEGISGIAAKENRALLINDNIKDNRIKSLLSRPQIKSSMVLPINAQSKTKGVMNLGVMRSSPFSFNEDNVGLVNKLIDLATITMSSGKSKNLSSVPA